MRKILVIGILLLLSIQGWAANPSPKSKQLNWGVLAYGGSDLWSNNSAADWAANRFSWIIGSNGSAMLSRLRSTNPNMMVFPYELGISRYGADTTQCGGSTQSADTVVAKTWPNYNDSLYIRMGPNPGDTAWVYADVSENCGAGTYAPMRTAPTAILKYTFYQSGSIRAAFDLRFSRVGDYLGWRLKSLSSSDYNNLNAGFMIDEESFAGKTGIATQGISSPYFPWKDSVFTANNGSTVGWEKWNSGTGVGFRHIRYPWSTALSWPQVMDSTRSLKYRMARAMRDSLKLVGKRLLPNITPLDPWAGSTMSFWNSEGRGTTVAYGGAMMGETTFPNPTSGNQATRETYCTSDIKACSDVRDSSVYLGIWQIRCNPCDSAAVGLGNARMNVLGFALDMFFPGNSTYMFGVGTSHVRNPDVTWHYAATGGGGGSAVCTSNNFSDTTYTWDDAWGKYFGIPLTTRDTATTGVDGASQAYTLHKVLLRDPRDTTKTQTVCYHRFARGTTYGVSTVSTPIVLPTGTWYELLSGGTYSAAIAGGTTVTIQNANTRVFIADTTLANNGVSNFFPLKISSNNHYLLGADSTPFFISGEDNWSMIAQLSPAQAKAYLIDRHNKGMNSILVNLFEAFFCDHRPNNYANVAPFTLTYPNGLNNAYLACADSIIGYADSLGMAIMLAPVYIGSGNQGWGTQISAASVSDMTTFGANVGTYFKNRRNIIWTIGGDNPPTGILSKINAFVSGLQSTDNVYPRIYTAHGGRGTIMSNTYPSPGSTWLTMNATYTSATDIITQADACYSSTVPLFFHIDGNYEFQDGNSTAFNTRNQSYWTVLRGGCGAMFGNCPDWASGSSTTNTLGSSCALTDWPGHWQSPGSFSQGYFHDFFASRHWWTLLPDLTGSVITGNAQSGLTQATFARASDSTCLVGYIPSPRTITVNELGIKTGNIHAQWFNPSSGVYTEILQGAKLASRNYADTFANDMVLLIDTATAVDTSISVADAVPVVEGNNISFVVTQNRVANMTFHYQTFIAGVGAGYAVQGLGNDYLGAAGTGTFSGGVTSVSIPITTYHIAGYQAPGSKVFYMVISAPSAGTVSRSQATGTILDAEVYTPPSTYTPSTTLQGAVTLKGSVILK